MFRRKILDKLEAWKQDKKYKPHILRGARQVGKTIVVNAFGTQFAMWFVSSYLMDGRSLEKLSRWATSLILATSRVK